MIRKMKAHRRLAIPVSMLAVLLLLASGCARGGLGANPLSSTDQVKIVKDVRYYHGSGYDKNRHILDLYIPKGANNYPVIFFAHGGAWVGGDKADTAAFGMAMAERGIGVVNINYRLYPCAKYPDFVKDVARAFDWTKSHIDEYGGNPKDIFTSGHSAGGHLSALLATNEKFLADRGHSLKDIRGEIGISGVYLITNERFRKVFFDSEDIRREASPVRNITKNTPPFLILYADNDLQDLGSQAQDMGHELKRENIPVTLVRVDGRTHATILDRIGTAGDPATAEIIKFVHHNKVSAKVKH